MIIFKELCNKFALVKHAAHRSFASSTAQSSPFTSNFVQIKKKNLVSAYEKYKLTCQNFEPKNEMHKHPNGVFCNNEINLKDIDVYGFDYDYTLAYYNDALYHLIFDLARDSLITNSKYPNELRSCEYLPGFPIRGLHLDKRRGWLMKVDSYHNIQLGTVYEGMYAVSNEDVIKSYGGTHRLNIDDIGYSQESSTLHHFVDLFCLPEICLFACTIQYFIDKKIDFTPEYVFQDIKDAVDSIHRTSLLHKSIVQNIEDYLLPIRETEKASSIYIKEFLTRLNKFKKKVFLITNSPFWFVNFGMQSLCGSDWQNLFDLVICNARKPDFFKSSSQPFRKFDIRTNSKAWDHVSEFKKNEIYYEGNLSEMLKHTGWSKSNGVLYFGDHIYGDLAEPFLKHGWRTGAILNEIAQEVAIVNKIEYQRNAMWLVALEKLIQASMMVDLHDNSIALDYDSIFNYLTLEQLRAHWLKERELLRQNSKSSFNPYFGSVFRTSNNPSLFSRRLARFADIYTSNITNLLNYPVDCHFMPRRSELPHEQSSNKLDVHVDLN